MKIYSSKLFVYTRAWNKLKTSHFESKHAFYSQSCCWKIKNSANPNDISFAIFNILSDHESFFPQGLKTFVKCFSENLKSFFFHFFQSFSGMKRCGKLCRFVSSWNRTNNAILRKLDFLSFCNSTDRKTAPLKVNNAVLLALFTLVGLELNSQHSIQH